MGSYWSLRLSSYDHRAAAVVSSVACFNPNNTIFTQSSPRFKQMFMYMAGYEDEEKFDEEVAQGMTVRGYLDKVKCPTLLVTGRVRSAVSAGGCRRGVRRLAGAEGNVGVRKPVSPAVGLPNLAGSIATNTCSTGRRRSRAALASGKRRIAYVRENGDGPLGECEWEPPMGAGQAYF